MVVTPMPHSNNAAGIITRLKLHQKFQRRHGKGPDNQKGLIGTVEERGEGCLIRPRMTSRLPKSSVSLGRFGETFGILGDKSVAGEHRFSRSSSALIPDSVE